MKSVNTNNAPAAVGPYTQAIITGNLVYTSGQIPLVPETGKLVEGGITEQSEQACKNIMAVLEAAVSDASKIVKTVCFLQNMADFASFNQVYAKYFTSLPARSCVEVAVLPKGALVEIEAIAEF